MSMNSVIAAIVCNCAISLVCLTSAYWALRLREQAVALRNCCDRWSRECEALSSTPALLEATRARLDRLQRLYQQQAIVRGRMRAMGVAIGIARMVLSKRR